MDKEVKVIAMIRKNSTGEVREYETNVWHFDGEETPSFFIWSEGNFSCDCNRHLFFQRVNSEEENHIECSDELYSVNIRNPKTGKIFYREFGGELNDRRKGSCKVDEHTL